MQQKIKLIIFWTAVIFITVAVFSLTIGQKVSYEFADWKVSHSFYNVIQFGFPIAIILTLFGNLKKENSKIKNGIIIAGTALVSILCLVIIFSLIFKIGFGNWVTSETIYRHKTENKVIKSQLYDLGAFGYGRRRIVEIKPIFKYWILPIEVDTSNIDTSQWKLVKEEGDIKFP